MDCDWGRLRIVGERVEALDAGLRRVDRGFCGSDALRDLCAGVGRRRDCGAIAVEVRLLQQQREVKVKRRQGRRQGDVT